VCDRRRTLGLKWERGRNMVTGLGPSLTEYGPTFAFVPLSLKKFNVFPEIQFGTRVQMLPVRGPTAGRHVIRGLTYKRAYNARILIWEQCGTNGPVWLPEILVQSPDISPASSSRLPLPAPGITLPPPLSPTPSSTSTTPAEICPRQLCKQTPSEGILVPPAKSKKTLVLHPYQVITEVTRVHHGNRGGVYGKLRVH
jgi:hypothetical protein